MYNPSAIENDTTVMKTCAGLSDLRFQAGEAGDNYTLAPTF